MSLRLNGSTSGYVEIDAPAVAGSNTLILPDGNGTSGQYLQTNGSGGLSWATLPASGKILQVVQAEKTDTASFSASSGNYDTFLSASITPSSTASKILILWTSNASSSSIDQRMAFRVLRNTIAVGVGDSAGSRISAGIGNLTNGTTGTAEAASQIILDSPNTTAPTTYNLQISCETGGGTVYINRSSSDNDANTFYRSASHLTLMEVAA